MQPTFLLAITIPVSIGLGFLLRLCNFSNLQIDYYQYLGILVKNLLIKLSYLLIYLDLFFSVFELKSEVLKEHEKLVDANHIINLSEVGKKSTYSSYSWKRKIRTLWKSWFGNKSLVRLNLIVMASIIFIQILASLLAIGWF